MGVNCGLNIPGEVGIGHGGIAQMGFVGLGQSDAFVDATARSLSRLDDRNGPVILLDDNLYAVSDSFEHGVKISSQFGFGHVDLRHTVIFAQNALKLQRLCAEPCRYKLDGMS